MLISYNWLKDYVDCSLDAAGVADLITNTGLEVEGLDYGVDTLLIPEGVVVGFVKEVAKHPDADRLTVCKVDIASGIDIQVVCGAPNVAAGQKIAFAPVGTTLRNAKGESITLENIKIRGVESAGMICAEDELGIGDDHSGIMVLSEDAETGKPLEVYFKNNADAVMEVAITPNRGDAVSHIGVARDMAAVLRSKIKMPDVSGFIVDGEIIPFRVDIDIPELCPRYCAVVMTNVKVQPSPEWMQERLKAVGLKPQNNIVDITNYVMMECGQPLHAFDLREVEGNRIVVRHEAKVNRFKTLDGKEVVLSGNEIMICDAHKPIAIAGVMGGENSMVSEDTVNVLIESACFKPVSIRKTAKLHGYNTDASYRFERAVDPSITAWAAKRAALMMKEYAEAQISSELIDAYPLVVAKQSVELDLAFLNQFVGKVIGREELLYILHSLEYEIVEKNESLLQLSVPTYKTDVTRPVDVIEDILRIYSYNKVESPKVFTAPLPADESRNAISLADKIAAYLTANGFFEALTPSFLSSAMLDKYPVNQDITPVKTLNAVNVKLDMLRHNFLFSGLEVLSYNYKRNQYNLKFFEFGKIYEQKKEEGYLEHDLLALWVTGNIEDSSWFSEDKKADFFFLKAMLYPLLKIAGLKGKISESVLTEALCEFALEIKCDDKSIAKIAKVEKQLCHEYDIKSDVYYAVLDMNMIFEHFEKMQLSISLCPASPQYGATSLC